MRSSRDATLRHGLSMPYWPTKTRAVAGLHLDASNPRLGREVTVRAPRDIIQYLFENDNAVDVAKSIADRGYFANEPLLAIQEAGGTVVVEGNRRLAALKALREPGLLEGLWQGRVERLSRRIGDLQAIAEVPVTLAPDRRSTDRLIAGRHTERAVMPWTAENRASFILEKLAEGYDNDDLRELLGFSEANIQAARQTRAIADMARSLDLPEEIRAKLDKPKNRVFTTLERVFDSSVGRDFLQVDADVEHGLRGKTTKAEFERAFARLVRDVVLGHASSRKLNKNDDIRKYFESWPETDRPKPKKGTFVPADIIQGRSVASVPGRPAAIPLRRTKPASGSVIPRDFKLYEGSDRLVDLRSELIRIKRERFPNAGAIGLRVFFELVVVDYLNRAGQMAGIVNALKAKGVPVPHGVPNLRQLVPAIVAIAKRELPVGEATRVEKALRYDAAAPFTVSDMHAFVHQSGDLPSARDIQQFWLRVAPLIGLLVQTSIPSKPT